MNREIKFRAWDKDKKKMSGSFEIKSYHHIFDSWQIGHSNILMQYTGLKDKNGLEVYEFDHLKCQDWIFEVRWNEKEAGFEFILISENWSPKMYCDPQEAEVVGNKYEN